MALKQLILNKRMSVLKKELDGVRAKDADFLLRKTAIETREAELEVAINEMTDESTAEEKSVVDEGVAKVESDKAELEAEEATANADVTRLEGELQKLQAELDEIESRKENPTEKPAAERKEVKMETKRQKFFQGLDTVTRDGIIAREDVKDFLARTRSLKGQKRAITGADLNIPDVLLDIVRDNLNRYSKLVSKVNLKSVSGKARQTVAGAIPEGIWTEAVGMLNELLMTFSQVEVDGYKVGGFIAISNSTLEDSDLNLAGEILDNIGQAIGIAVDKAIAFGTGSKMPVGIATRLAQTSQPSYWDTDAAEWTDLHTNNLLKFDPAGMSAETFFANLVAYLGVAKPNYSNGAMFWAMNTKTKNVLIAKAIAFNAAGALTASLTNTMPIVGGEIVILEFMADNDILGGYGSLYLLAERAGSQLAVSDQVKFTEDQTVFKGTARYDGLPVIGEAFVMVNIANAAPTTTTTFGTDTANTVEVPYALPIAGTYVGAQTVGLYDITPGAVIYYTVDGSTPDATKTKLIANIAVAATKTIKAIAIKDGISSAVLTAAYIIS